MSPWARSRVRRARPRRRYRLGVHVGLVCPYSLTVPGGVQGQVLGLARSLRAPGPRRPGAGAVRRASSRRRRDAARPVRAAGDQRVDRARRPGPAVRPADDPGARRRDVRRRAPARAAGAGPVDDGPAVHRVPMVGTFHRAGSSSGVHHLRPAGALGRRPARTAVRGVRGRRGDGGRRSSAASTDVAVQRHRDRPVRQGRPVADRRGRRSCSSAATSPARASTSCVDAMDRLPAPTRLWVAGEGERTGDLKARTEGDRRIEWLGSISEEEKARRLRGADVFCAPSLHSESFGVVLLEAMAAQTAIVASDLPGYRRVARPGSTPCWCRRETPRPGVGARSRAGRRVVPGAAGGVWRAAGGRVLHGPAGRALRLPLRTPAQ